MKEKKSKVSEASGSKHDGSQRKREQKAARKKNTVWLNLTANPSNSALQSLACPSEIKETTGKASVEKEQS